MGNLREDDRRDRNGSLTGGLVALKVNDGHTLKPRAAGTAPGVDESKVAIRVPETPQSQGFLRAALLFVTGDHIKV